MRSITCAQKNPASSAGFEMVEADDSPGLPAVVVTMVVVNRGVGRHNRTSQNRERENGK